MKEYEVRYRIVKRGFFSNDVIEDIEIYKAQSARDAKQKGEEELERNIGNRDDVIVTIIGVREI